MHRDSDRSTSSNSTDLLFVSNSNTYDQENNTFTDTLLDIDDTVISFKHF